MKTQTCSPINHYFHSIITMDDGILPNFPSRLHSTTDTHTPTTSTAPHPPPSSNPSFTISDVRISQLSPRIMISILYKLKTNAAPGPDQLTLILFKKIASSISFPLSLLFRSIVDLHELPLEWKTSIITPIFKKLSPSDSSNYTGQSLKPVHVVKYSKQLLHLI